MTYGLYIHIPYCQSRCRYCDFYSQPAVDAVPDAYIDALARDFLLYAPRDEAGTPLPPATVYFGGGTPSLLAPGQVQRLLQLVRPAQGAEITLEANPESSSLEKLAGWRGAGVNRLSFGVQTANAASLRRLGRLHTPQGAAAAMAAAQAAGFVNISGDCMLALPGYTAAEFDETLHLLQTGGSTHISAYILKLEENTPFGKNPPTALPDEDEAADFYLYAARQLEAAGYVQYEISNFAQKGFEGRHNLLYWNMADWLGLGPAAHSSLFGRRFSFLPNAPAFLRGANAPQFQGPVEANDYIMMRLRLAEGLLEQTLAARFGVALTQKQRMFFDTLVQKGLAKPLPGGWALTPQGMLVQNAVLGQLLGEHLS